MALRCLERAPSTSSKLDADRGRIASLRMLPDKLTARAGAGAPNRIGVADGGSDQHGRTARDYGSSGSALPIGRSDGEGAGSRRAVQVDRLASQARDQEARR